MEFKEELQLVLKELGSKIEYERFLMSKGKCEFAKMLGMRYHTYMAFLKGSKMTREKNVSAIANFLVNRGVDMEDLSRKIVDLMNKEVRLEEVGLKFVAIKQKEKS